MLGLYSKEGKIKKRFVHRLVATAFIEKVNPDYVVNHIDGIKTNNNVTNLEWCSIRDNVLHGYKIGLSKPIASKEKHFNSKLTERDIYEIRKHYEYGMKQKDIAKLFGVIQQNISFIVRNKTWI